MNSRHHRIPRSKGGKSNAKNISHVSQAQHRAYHLLFECEDPEGVARILNETWIDPDWELIARKK